MNDSPALRRFLVILMLVTLFFSVLFGTVLSLNLMQMNSGFILDNPILEAERARVEEGADPALFRELHLMVRRAWFIRTEQLRWGRLFLIVSLGLFFFSWQSLMVLYGKPKAPGRDSSFLSVPGDGDARSPDRPRSERTLPFGKRVMQFALTAVILAGGAGVLSSFLAETLFPGLAADNAPSKDSQGGTVAAKEDQTCPCKRIHALSVQYRSVAEDSGGNSNGLRGAAGTGARFDGEAPLSWNLKTGESVLWNVSLPGAGRGSPVVWGDRVYLTAEENGSGLILCYNLPDGALLWRFDLAKAGIPRLPESEPQAGLAAPTPACDKNGVYAAFSGGVTVGVNHDGALLWKRDPGPLTLTFGYASSPRVYQGRLYLQYDHEGDSRLEVLNTADGTEVWKKERLVGPSWSSPTLVDTGKEVMLVTLGSENVTVSDPLFGDTLWEKPLLRGDIAPLPAYDGSMLYVVSPGIAVTAVSLFKGEELWSYDAVTPDVASPLAADGKLYIPSSFGVFHCVDGATGSLLWELDYGIGWYASPILIGKHLYLFDREGSCEIVNVDDAKADPVVLSVGESVDATPAWTGKVLLVRTEKRLIALGGNK